MGQGSSADEQSRPLSPQLTAGESSAIYLPVSSSGEGWESCSTTGPTSSFFTPIGLALGLILGTYLVIHRCVRIPQMESHQS